MFVFQIKEMMAQKGILRPYAQLIKMGIARTSAQKLLSGTATHLSLSHLFMLCTYLNCTPKELLKIELPKRTPNADGTFPVSGIEGTPLKDWMKKDDINLVKELIQLTPDELEKMKDFYREMKES
jgi:DNA-binding Xre family transcriptional regulator